MPRLVRTPEEVLRKTRRDLYYIKFHQADACVRDMDDIPGRRDILDWFARECPKVRLEDLGPPETSGIISGGIGILVRVVFDKKSLAKYCAAWENADGSSKDPRWTCYIYPYAQYRKNAAEIRKQSREIMDAV